MSRPMRLARRGLIVVSVLALGSACGATSESPALPALPVLKIDPGRITVSGLSSGGAMAVQFHVAHSSLVHGAGILAAPPYDCAEGAVAAALGRCMKGGSGIPVEQLLATADRFAGEGRIDPAAGLRGDRVWLYRGAADPHVDKGVADALERFYRARIDDADIVRVELEGASHNFPSTHPAGSPCSAAEPPYVGQCNYDGAAALLSHLYGVPAATPSPPGKLQSFQQGAYAATAGSAALADQGWLYVPAACAGGEACGLHVVLHGCRQGGTEVGDAFVVRSGYLAAADAHRTVLLFPQVQPTLSPLNPLGCWDWWGYEGEDYATRNGRQVRAIKAMVDALTGSSG